MKTEKNILIAFLLNLFFSVFEFVGGLFTGSIAIVSDSIHDLTDAAGIGISYFLERKSKKGADNLFTYGYSRYSVMGGLITSVILLFSSAVVIYNSILKILSPTEINYNGMIVFAVFGVIVNSSAAFFTHGQGSLNQRAVNLHMLEDVLGWVIVLIGAIIMKFTSISIIDPLMSIGVAVFILINAIGNIRAVLDIFLEKVPEGVDINEIKEHISAIKEVIDIHHIHIWSLDGVSNLATMHIVCEGNPAEIKKQVREELKEHGICHATLETESPDDICNQEECYIDQENHGSHHHHHHHHH